MADLENNEKPLRKIADAFKELEATVNSQMPGADVEVAPFSMADLENNEKPLRKIANAFKELKETENSQTPDVDLAPFSRACSLVAPLIGCLGIAFKFAEMDFSAKVNDLAEASKSIGTLQIMIDRDIKDNRVRKAGSHTRNLLRVKRSLDLVKAYFEQILVTEGSFLKGPFSKAYAQVFAPYHGWAIRKAVAAGMYALPTKEQMLSQLNEDVLQCIILWSMQGSNCLSWFWVLAFWSRVNEEEASVFDMFRLMLASVTIMKKGLGDGSGGWLGCSLYFWAAQSCCNCYWAWAAWHCRSLLLS